MFDVLEEEGEQLVEDLLESPDSGVDLLEFRLGGLATSRAELREIFLDGVQERLDALVELCHQRPSPLSEDVSIGFNARYLLDFLGVVGSPEVRLELNPQKEGETAGTEASDKPGQLRPEPEEDLSYRYVVMPMHL